MECQNRGTAKRRARGPRHCEEEGREGVVGRRRQSRSGLRELPPRYWYPGDKALLKKLDRRLREAGRLSRIRTEPSQGAEITGRHAA